MKIFQWMLVLTLALNSACKPKTPPPAAASTTPPASTPGLPNTASQCADYAPDAFVLRQDLVAGLLKSDARLLLRFAQFTDDHVIDDDGQAFVGASFLDPVASVFEAAQRLQEEYSDEALNDMIQRINACHARFPMEFVIVTGDSADLTTVAETRRFIDNLDGSFDQPSAFEQACAAAQPAGLPAQLLNQLCTRFTGRGVADTQSVDPDVDDPTFQFLPSRTLQQILNTEQAAISGRAADGSTDPTRQTLTRSPGLPEPLRCQAGLPACGNERLALPYWMAFGNHDAYLRGTLPLLQPANEFALAFGRHFMLNPHEFIDEFFFSADAPGPVGHGFNFADTARREDNDDRNDGYYAVDAGGGRFRMIVMNTIMDGKDPRIPLEVLRNPFALADGTMDAAQFEWIKTELARASARGQLVMVFSHHPDLSFAESGSFAALLPIEVTAAELNAELASWPNLIAWVAGHTHLHRIRAFKVDGAQGSNGDITTPVTCKTAGACKGFWQIETASLIDFPQEQRVLEVFDNGDGTGVIRAPVIQHRFERSKALAERDDRCALYLSDPAAVAAGISDGGLDAVCQQGGVRQGQPEDRNVELLFALPLQ